MENRTGPPGGGDGEAAGLATLFTPGMVALLAGGALAIALGVTGVLGAGRTATADADAAEFRGMLLPEPLEKPDFRLEDTAGRSFAFRAETEGHLTFLFFGFTHCPDVCPVQLANLAAALDGLSWESRRRIKVVFVTTDAERDTPARIREWLDHFDRSFIGLRGGLEEVNRIQSALLLPAAIRQDLDDGDYLIGHASQIIAFTADEQAVLYYPFGTRQADWLHDLPLLLERGGAGPRVVGAVIPAPPPGRPAAVYMEITNESGTRDELVGASAGRAARVEMHHSVQRGETRVMQPVSAVPVPADGRVSLVPGGYHLMLHGLRRPLAPGESLELELRFRSGLRIAVPADVIPYAELDAWLAARQAGAGGD